MTEQISESSLLVDSQTDDSTTQDPEPYEGAHGVSAYGDSPVIASASAPASSANLGPGFDCVALA
ncbi:MAG: hypothetical protein KJO18_03130, partial [Acidimicrobiia bacterium]|nr:hypothetical protein [Acidimicrobiia bacterium]